MAIIFIKTYNYINKFLKANIINFFRLKQISKQRPGNESIFAYPGVKQVRSLWMVAKPTEILRNLEPKISLL